MNSIPETVLRGLVQMYIETAEPVGSVRLRQKLTLSLSPATIRNIFRELEEAGFIFQPHTSAGRIPTDKGYRFYVDHNQAPQVSPRGRLPQTLQDLVHELARRTHTLALAGIIDTDTVEQAGMSELVEQPETVRREALEEISHFLDHMHGVLEQAASLPSPTTRVFIGHENPFMSAEHVSLLVRTVTDRSGQKTVMVLLGPKRMPYPHHVSLLEHVAAYLRHQAL